MFTEAMVELRDLTDDAQPVADLHLMHRLDAELDDDAWRAVFACIEAPILFVPNVVLSVVDAAREIGRRLIRRGRLTNAGWFRNEAALRSLWTPTHSTEKREVAGVPAFLLRPHRL
jgi:hypothetical protein